MRNRPRSAGDENPPSSRAPQAPTPAAGPRPSPAFRSLGIGFRILQPTLRPPVSRSGTESTAARRAMTKGVQARTATPRAATRTAPSRTISSQPRVVPRMPCSRSSRSASGSGEPCQARWGRLRVPRKVRRADDPAHRGGDTDMSEPMSDVHGADQRVARGRLGMSDVRCHSPADRKRVVRARRNQCGHTAIPPDGDGCASRRERIRETGPGRWVRSTSSASAAAVWCDGPVAVLHARRPVALGGWSRPPASRRVTRGNATCRVAARAPGGESSGATAWAPVSAVVKSDGRGDPGVV